MLTKTLQDVFQGGEAISQGFSRPGIPCSIDNVETFTAIYARNWRGKEKLVRFEPIPNFFPPDVLTKDIIRALNANIGIDILPLSSTVFEKDRSIPEPDYFRLATPQDERNITRLGRFCLLKEREFLRVVHYKAVPRT